MFIHLYLLTFQKLWTYSLITWWTQRERWKRKRCTLKMLSGKCIPQYQQTWCCQWKKWGLEMGMRLVCWGWALSGLLLTWLFCSAQTDAVTGSWRGSVCSGKRNLFCFGIRRPHSCDTTLAQRLWAAFGHCRGCALFQSCCNAVVICWDPGNPISLLWLPFCPSCCKFCTLIRSMGVLLQT